MSHGMPPAVHRLQRSSSTCNIPLSSRRTQKYNANQFLQHKKQSLRVYNLKRVLPVCKKVKNPDNISPIQPHPINH